MSVKPFKMDCVKAFGLTDTHETCRRIARRILSWFGGSKTRKYEIAAAYLRVSQYVTITFFFLC